MVEILWINPDEKIEKSHEIFHQILIAKSDFFEKLTLERINTACEKTRKRFIQEWNKGGGPGLGDISRETALVEAQPPFELYEPNTICVYFQDFLPESTYAAMGIQRLNIEEHPPKHFVLRVSLNNLYKEDENYYWKINSDKYGCYVRILKNNNNYTLKQVPHTINTMVFHEFMHACGDSEWLGRKDGRIRPEYIGLNSIIDLGQNITND